MKIRPLETNDWPSICRIYAEVRKRQFPWISASQIDENDLQLHAAGEDILVAEKNGEIVGFISVWRPESFVHHLFVQTDDQRQGIGGDLLDAAVARYPLPLRLKCVAANGPAVAFYRKKGWREVSRDFSEDGAYLLFEWNG